MKLVFARLFAAGMRFLPIVHVANRGKELKRLLAWVVLFLSLPVATSHAQQREMRVGWLIASSSGSFVELTVRAEEVIE